MRRLFLRDSQAGDIIEDVLVITGKQLSATSTNKYFIKAFVSDRSCQMVARMWNATRELFNAIPESGFVRVRGRVENYQNNSQFIIEQVWPPKEGSFDVEDLLPHTTKDINVMCQQLFELCGSIQNRHLAAIVQAYLDDEPLMNDFCRAPAAMTFHHAFIGGLLEHTLNAMHVADCISRFYPLLNRDLVIAGIFLHDIAKTWELSYETAFGYTDGGQLIGHIVKGAMWVDAKAKAASETLGEPIPQQLIDVIQHIILSHHNLAEYGSPKSPSTPEAIFVHYIEDLDAKLMMSLEATRGEASQSCDGNWTDYIKALNGRLYRPDVAPADAPIDATGAEVPPARPIDGRNDARQSAPAAASGGGAGGFKISNPLFETTSSRKK
ncbi:MAG: HD domain-containing protein [Phycisphaerae bacterium]|nr:HD domain-containing protein [Phycisphaerae bacterium]